VAASLPEARARAEQAIDDGSAAAKLAALVARSNQQDRASTDA
jgi:anthranilate phosphoribosyltransferase